MTVDYLKNNLKILVLILKFFIFFLIGFNLLFGSTSTHFKLTNEASFYFFQAVIFLVFFLMLILKNESLRQYWSAFAIILPPFCCSFLLVASRIELKSIIGAITLGLIKFTPDPIVIIFLIGSILWIKNLRNEPKSSLIFRLLFLFLILFLIFNNFTSINLRLSLFSSIALLATYLAPLFLIQTRSAWLRNSFRFIVSSALIAIPALFYVVIKRGIPITAEEFLKIKLDLSFMMRIGDFLYGNSNNLCDLYLLIISLCLLLLEINAFSKIRKIIIFFSMNIFLFLFLSSYSRASILALFLILISMIILFWKLKGGKIAKWSTALLIYLILIHILSSAVLKYTGKAINFGYLIKQDLIIKQDLTEDTPITNSDNSIKLRKIALKRAINFAKNQLPFGSGLGTYHILDKELRSPHNNLLLAIVETGIAGLIFNLLVFAALASCFPRAYTSKNIVDMWLIITSFFFFLKASLVGGLIVNGAQTAPGFMLSAMLIYLKNSNVNFKKI